MSTLSFAVFCVEYYADHINKPSSEVYQMFKQSGLLDLLYSDYDDLHGMSFEWLMDYFDRFLEDKL